RFDERTQEKVNGGKPKAKPIALPPLTFRHAPGAAHKAAFKARYSPPLPSAALLFLHRFGVHHASAATLDGRLRGAAFLGAAAAFEAGAEKQEKHEPKRR